MLRRWLRYLVWRPFAIQCRRFPLWPLSAKLTRPVEDIVCIRIDNVITRALSRFSGGYDYAVCYLVEGELLIDTGFPWARRKLLSVLTELGADRTLNWVVNTHYHEDHTGNNDAVAELRPTAVICAHSDSINEMRFPPELPWYRNFLFGPLSTAPVQPIADEFQTKTHRWQTIETPGHCPGHLCLFEPDRRWLFSGDLYIAADLDSQLGDADGPDWIASLQKVMQLKPSCMFDAHGSIFIGEDVVREQLKSKLSFLEAIRDRVFEEAVENQTITELTGRVFDQRDWLNRFSFSEGWMSLITGSDFARSNLVRSFLREMPLK